ncbi:trigger factor [Guggenheimella bovis]
MKTKLLSYPMIEDLPFEPEMLKVQVEKEEIEKRITDELNRIAKRYGQVIETEADYMIQEGDIVTIKVESELPKYNKPKLPLTVGKGLYNRFLEYHLIGMRKGDAKKIQIDEKDVLFTVLDVKTKNVPELTWDMLKREISAFYPDVDSIESYKKVMEKEFIEDAAVDRYYEDAAEFVSQYLIENIKLDVDPEELQAFKDRVYWHFNKEAKENGVSYDDYIIDMFIYPGEDSKDVDLKKRVEETMERDFKFSIYAKEILKDEDLPILPVDYEASIEAWAKEFERSVEDFKEVTTYEEFVTSQYIEAAQHRIVNKYLADVKVEII